MRSAAGSDRQLSSLRWVVELRQFVVLMQDRESAGAHDLPQA